MIREARRDDVPALVAADRTVFVAEDDGIVGICSLALDLESVRYGQRAWVEDLAVDPEHRSAGHGKALLDAAKDWGRERERPDYRSVQFGWVV